MRRQARQMYEIFISKVQLSPSIVKCYFLKRSLKPGQDRTTFLKVERLGAHFQTYHISESMSLSQTYSKQMDVCLLLLKNPSDGLRSRFYCTGSFPQVERARPKCSCITYLFFFCFFLHSSLNCSV